MKILRADYLGMCFGVRDAIALALQHAQHEPLTVLGDLVHNETVLAQLRERGIKITQHSGAIDTPRVMITAHGASQKAIARVRERGLHVTEATCPLVHVAYRAVERLARDGFHPVIVGKRDHVEVRGLTEDLPAFDVVLSEADVVALQPRPRFGVAAQTTQPVEKVRHLVECIRRQFPDADVRFVDTVCQPTKQRQNAAIELAQRADVVIVVGGAHSNNTRELVETSRRYCSRVHHVQTVADLREEWLASAEFVGLTAGTSTPESSIDQVEQWLRQFAARQPVTRVSPPAFGPGMPRAHNESFGLPASPSPAEMEHRRAA